MKSDRGAMDVGSLIFGVLVTALVSALAAVALLGVTPWVQDTLAKNSLAAVVEAQKIAYTTDGAYASEQRLIDLGLLDQRHAGKADIRALRYQWDGEEQQRQNAGQFFYAGLLSGSGKIYSATETQTIPAISAAPQPEQPKMVTYWDTSIPGCSTIVFPTNKQVIGEIDWGDGTRVAAGTLPSKTYPAGTGRVEVTFYGTFNNFNLAMPQTVPIAKCLTDVGVWKGTKTTNLRSAFEKAANLKTVPRIPEGVTSLFHAFWDARNFNGDISQWDTSSVTDMDATFFRAKAFNQPLHTWDTSNVSNLNGTFLEAAKFSQDLSSWDIGKVTTHSNTFKDSGMEFKSNLWPIWK